MRSRSPGDFAEFVTARGPSLHRTAYLLVGERGLAQDLLQEALTTTWVHWPRLKDTSRAEAWTRRALHPTVIGCLRGPTRRRDLEARQVRRSPGSGHQVPRLHHSGPVPQRPLRLGGGTQG